MGLFDKERAELPVFKDKGEAFTYMLALRVAAGIDALVAAREAGEFAELVAANTGLPEKQTPPAQGIDKYIEGFEKCCKCVEAHPKLVEFAVPLLSFAAGIFVKKETTPPCESAAPSAVDATTLE
jgi:hypothetical protein